MEPPTPGVVQLAPDQTRVVAFLCHTTAQRSEIAGILGRDITDTASTGRKIDDRLKSAELIVNQRWERMMMRPNGVEGLDRILTTQRHRETWRHTERGWQGGEVEELGGDVYVNGEYYQPN